MRKTVLNPAHVAAGARLVDFHGWEMPVQYVGILEETRLVRSHAGIFDLCHMGRLTITGRDREALVEHVFSSNLGKMKLGKAKYGFLLNEQGFPNDDVIVYRDKDAVHIVINAGNRERDDAWVRERLKLGKFQAKVENASDTQAMIAIQGRDSEATLQPLTSIDLSQLGYYAFATAQVCGVTTLIARTGYTGEDGFEVFPPADKGMLFWEAFLGAGRPFGVAPIGLGARDALRHTGRVPRQGSTLHDGDRLLGKVASGTASATLGKNIATGFVPLDKTAVGTRFEIDIRGARYPVEVVQGPFYKRAR
jgi:aminomethyltransferase